MGQNLNAVFFLVLDPLEKHAMKPSFAIALLVCGVVLICVPPISDYVHDNQILQAQQTIANSPSGAPNVHLNPISDIYRVGCFFVGAVMVVIAIIGSPGQRRPLRDPPPQDPATR
jgi:hypothetical protein